MADAKISELTAIDAVAGGDLIPIVDDPAGTPATKKATASQIKDYILSLANTWTATQTIDPADNTSALVVSGYSLTGSNAQSLVDLAGTWNTTGTPTAIKLNITNTASNAASLLMDLQVGGVTQFNVKRNGIVRSLNGFFNTAETAGLEFSGTSVRLYAAGGNTLTWVGGGNVSLASSANNTLEQRNSTNAQTFMTYGTYTDGANYRRVALTMTTAGVASLTAEGAGTGASGNVLHISGLPTSNPGAGILWNNAGTVEVGT